AISIIPGNGFLGFVRQLDEKEYTASSLTTILKRIVYLEAGHRAVFLKGIYGVGGGSTGGDEKRRHDDLAKVNCAMDQILGNQLISTTADFDSEEARQSFKQNLRDVLKQVTDLVLRFGFQSGKFDPIYETAVKERFLSQIYMD